MFCPFRARLILLRKMAISTEKKVRNVNELTCLASSKKVLMRCRSRIFSSSTKNKMKTLDPQIKTCTSVIWVVFVTLTKWESILRLLAEQYYFCDELLPSPNDFGQSNFLWKWSWWRSLPSLTWLLHEVSSEKFDFSLVFFTFTSAAASWKRLSFRSETPLTFPVEKRVPLMFSGRSLKNQKSGRKSPSSFLIFSIPPRKDDSSKNRKIDFLFFDESSFLGGMEKIKKLDGFFFPDFWFYQFRPENMIHQEIKNVGGGRKCFFRPIYRSISTYLISDFWNIYILKNLKHSLSSTARLM